MDRKTYLLVPDAQQNQQEDFNKITTALQHSPDLNIEKIDNSTVMITYKQLHYKAHFTRSQTPNGKLQMHLMCDIDDSETPIIFKVLTSKFGYRVFSIALNCFLPESTKMIDLSTMILKPEVNELFQLKNLKPIFYLNYASLYFVQALDGSIHIINVGLLDFLVTHRGNSDTQELHYKVAPNLQRFVAMFDEGLIPDNFYEYYQKSTKIINHSGFDIKNINRKVFIQPFIFELNNVKQGFYKLASEGSSLLYADKVRPGETLDISIKRILRELQIAHDYIGAVIENYVEFDRDKEGKLTPRLRIHIFVETIERNEQIETLSQRTWRSLDK